MKIPGRVLLVMSVCLATATCFVAVHEQNVLAAAQCNAPCDKFHIDDQASTALSQVAIPPENGCTPRMSNGFPLPDSKCTPGAINPTLTVDVLRDPEFRTCCVRNNKTSEKQKNETYMWYSIPHPSNNTGPSQSCELDHLISLELGGSDGLENIWPQCGPDGVSLPERYFKQKDMVENYLAKQVKAAKIDLADAQKRIADDLTQFLEDAKRCASGGC
jgi:hypothetical protein